ncbi:AAA family ATPase [Rhizophagus irregularis DAOM 181602=DAOM 197198]|nr:AAA family ATPase [Rhizophagus irregularis DAOM 181602=DAOM 197198]
MFFSKITQVFRRTVFPTHFITSQVQRLRSPRSDLFQLSFSRTYNITYWELYEENERLKRERNEMLDGYNKFKALQKEKQGCTFIDKTSLIAEFIKSNSDVSLVVWPRRFGKTTNLTMLKEFFSIPIYPDNENYYRELFRDTKIMERSCLLDSHFCKYLVIFLSLKGFDVCDTWLKMEALLCQELASLYKEHGYINDILDNYEKLRFNKILSGNFEHAVIIKSLEHLSKYLRTYHRRRCIVLVDEYDHPMEIAYRYQYYEKARGFFSSLFGALLKDNDKNLEKTLLVGVSRIAKSGYLSELNNLNKERLNEVKEWYDGYKAGNGICLYNPWSINQFIDTNTLDAHWVNTGGTATIKKLLWHSTKDFKKETLTLLKKDVIDVKILKDIDYNTLSPRVIWTLLYYEGYLTMNEDKNLCIPNIKVFTEWKEWLNNRISSNPDIMLEMLLQCNLTKFEEELPTMIMESLSYLDTINSNLSYHFLMIGILSPVRYHNYELLLNREAGEGRFDVKIVPITENVIYPILIIMEFKVYKKNKKIIDNDEYGDEDEDKTEH